MATLTIYDGSADDTFNIGTTSGQVAQSFKIAANSVIDSIGIKGSRGNNATAGTFRVRIYEGGADPTAGTLVKDETFNRDVLPVYTASPTMQTVTFTTPTATLTGGATVYYVVMDCPTGSINDCIRWSLDTTATTYADGSEWYNISSWIERTSYDHNFAIYGTIGAGATYNEARRMHMMMM